MSDDAHLLVNRVGDVLHLVLNRPDRLNALSPEMREGLVGVLRAEQEAPRETAARAILISAAGRSFCSGADLDPDVILARRDTIADEMEAGINQLVQIMRSMPVPIVAAVQGPAAGAGFSIALCADLMLVSQSTKLILSFSRIGAMMDGGATHILPRKIGQARAAAMALLARPVNGAEAVEWGLALELCDDDALQSKAEELAQRLASGPTRAFGLIKQGLENGQDASLRDALFFEAQAQQKAFASADFEEGVTAFREKRKPRFKGH